MGKLRNVFTQQITDMEAEEAMKSMASTDQNDEDMALLNQSHES